MSVNNSSTLEDHVLSNCYNSPTALCIATTVAVLRSILVVPLSTLVLYLGHQRRRRQQHILKTASHSDVFSYHLALMELSWFIGALCIFFGLFSSNSAAMTVGTYFSSIIFYGEMFFHLLTCVERYLAVVFPITYMGLKNARGVKIRNICTGCVWLFCFGLICVTYIHQVHVKNIALLCIVFLCIVVVSFCSLSVLCVLIHPGPGGGGGGETDRVDQTKRRAFHTLTALSAVLWLSFSGHLFSTAMRDSPRLDNSVLCVVTVSTGLLNLPNSLVSPLLYLNKAGKLSCVCYEKWMKTNDLISVDQTGRV